MIVVMTDISQKEGLGIGGESRLLEGRRGRGCPPGIEMRTRTASQPGTPPAAIDATGAFIVQPADVNGHSLQQEGGALSDRLIPSLGELVEELLMAVNGTGRTCRPEFWLERNGVSQGLILTLRSGGRM